MTLSNVDLPLPEGPINATSSPCSMARSMPLSTSSRFEPEPNPFVSRSMESTKLANRASI